MIQWIILGIIQGITEWLPISSEGLIVLARVHLFGETSVRESIHVALFLHLGTFFAALIYFRVEVWTLLRSLLQYRQSSIEKKAVLRFLVVSTFFSGLIGFGLLKSLDHMESHLAVSGKVLTGIIGLLVLITATLQLKAKTGSRRGSQEATLVDGVLLGVVQGMAILPGLSRSGLTISALLLRKFDDSQALTLSFLMSLPVVLGGNILLNLNHFTLTLSNLMGCLFAFVFGLATIHILLSISKKINFGYFMLLFGLLMLLSVFL